ncbi:MAG TPA: hypothetical protein VFX70_06345, partial [Mycobacteriales bacterium]|nr:hypothetical protein [Mycobacteriales bacterium]
LLPGGPLAGVVAPDAPFGQAAPDLVDRWGAGVLAAAGVLRTFAVLRVPDAVIGSVEHDLDGEGGYHDALVDLLPESDVPPQLAELAAVRDLELVDPTRWPAALNLLVTEFGPLLDTPAVAVLPDRGRVPVPAYTRWWLSRHPVLDGRRPVELRLPGAVDLDGLYDPVGQTDPRLLAAVGCLTGLADVLADPELAADLLVRLGDPDRRVSAVLLREVYARLVTALDGYDPEPPVRVRVAPKVTWPAGDAVVLDEPYLLPLLAGRAVLPAGGAPGPVADLCDVDLASELASELAPEALTGWVLSRPARTLAWSAVPGAGLAAARCGAPVPPARVCWHEDLRVAARGAGIGGTPVPWWPDGDTDHVDLAAGPAALGRALAWRCDRWDRRAAAAEALSAAVGDPGELDTLTAEDSAE